MSFSMRNDNRIQYAKEAVAVLGEVLNNLGVPFAITGYSAYEALRRYRFKTFDESYPQVRSRLVNADYKGNTVTSEQIPFAHRRLVARTEKKKVLVVITDAEHIESHYRLKRAMDNVKSDGIELVGVGICTDLMSQYFDRFIQLNDLTNFGRELLSLLRDVLR
jgi:cobalamin biosynthesis protein CobT